MKDQDENRIEKIIDSLISDDKAGDLQKIDSSVAEDQESFKAIAHAVDQNMGVLTELSIVGAPGKDIQPIMRAMGIMTLCQMESKNTRIVVSMSCTGRVDFTVQRDGKTIDSTHVEMEPQVKTDMVEGLDKLKKKLLGGDDV